MIKYLYPLKDATIYQRYPAKNTGVDAILELSKYTIGTPVTDGLDDENWESNYLSRLLIHFDVNSISQGISAGKISPNFTASLILKATEAESLPIQYNVVANAVANNWTNGTGFYANDPEITNGVSWRYSDSKTGGTLWPTGSLPVNATASWGTGAAHGGTWYTGSGYEVSQSFNHEFPDIRMNVTPIIRTWVSGSIPNYGFILKFPDSSESDNSILGSIKFFSKETHTIFIPRLEFQWDDSENSGIGNFNEVNQEDYIIHFKNIQESYRDGEVAKVRLSSRPKYPLSTFATSSNYLTEYRLPTSSYYSVIDYWTEDTIIDFGNGSKISCDDRGNYFKIDMGSFLPERYYKFQVKTEFEGGDISKIIDDGFIFKVVR